MKTPAMAHFLSKVAVIGIPATLLKIRFHCRCFPMNFTKCFKAASICDSGCRNGTANYEIEVISISDALRTTLRKKCPYSELFWSVFFGIWSE